MTTDYSDGDILYGVDVDNLVENSARNGVLTGLGVTENTPTPDMNVIVAAGTGFAGEAYVNKASSTVVPITTAHATLDRLDIIVINSSATISAVAGTPATPPDPPDLPDDSILLAIVEVDAAVTQILNGDIIDRRLLLGSIQEAMIANASITDAKINTSSWSYAKKDAAETISGAWNFNATTTIGQGNELQFKDSSNTLQGKLKADATNKRLQILDPSNNVLFTIPGSVAGVTVMRAISGQKIVLQNAADAYQIVEIDSNSTTLGGIDPTNDAKGILGDVNAWWQLRACNLNDVCSEILIPKKALETLENIMLEEIGAKIREESAAHILKSEKLPHFLREEKKPAIPPIIIDGNVIFPGRAARPGHMRNLSATVSFLQGCVLELLERMKAGGL